MEKISGNLKMKKYKIILPETKITPKDVERKIKRRLKEYKEGILSKVFVFAYLSQPFSTTELTKKLKNYYHQEFDRATIFRYLKELVDDGLLSSTTTGYVFSIKNNNDIYSEIKEKFHKFIEKIPEQFQKKFHNINYFYISEYGEKFIPWACDVIGFKYTENE